MRPSRELMTSISELVGAAAVTAGVFVLFGAGTALVVGGVLLIFAGFLASGGGK